MFREEMEAKMLAYHKNGWSPKMMENRDKIGEDEHQCHFCTDFCYLSLIKCRHCKIFFCVNHKNACGCSLDRLELVYRYSMRELQQFAKAGEKLAM